MQTKRIPLFGSLTNRNANPNSFTTKDQRFENCYPEVIKNPLSGQGQVNLYKRLGTAHTATAGGSFVGTRGALVWTGAATPRSIFSFSDGTDTKIYDTSGSIVGAAITGTTGPFWMGETLISGVSNITAISVKTSDGLPHAWFFPEGGAWTEITDADYPANQGTPLTTTGEMVHMDGFAFIMATNGTIWNSDINSLANWTATSFISAGSMPDKGCGLARYKNLIASFSIGSIEFFQNGGTTVGSPLVPVGNALRRIGAAKPSNAKTILTVTDTVYFIGVSSDSGQIGVYRLNGYTPEKVSNAAVDKLLAQLGAGAVGFSGSFNAHGMTHVLLYTAATAAPCYCVDTNTWWYLSPSATQRYWTACCDKYFNTGFLAGSGIFDFSATAFQDNTQTFTQTVQTDNIDLGTQHRKFCHRLRPVCDVQSAASTLTVKYSDDDFATFTTWGTIDLSSQAAIENGLTRGGSFKRRSFQFTHSANTPNRMSAFELEFDVGTA